MERKTKKKKKKKTGVRLHDRLFHMYPAVRTETECLVYIPVTCVTSHIHPERKREKEKTYLHDPKPSRFVIHLFSPIITREREREKELFFSSCVPRFSIFARAA